MSAIKTIFKRQLTTGKGIAINSDVIGRNISNAGDLHSAALKMGVWDVEIRQP